MDDYALTAEARPTRGPRRRFEALRRPRPVTVVLLVTAVGALLRFWDLGRQSPWCDESTTAFRICGTYADLLGQLRDQGFGPLWYTLLYAFVHAVDALTGGDGRAFSPAVLRLVPAFCGSLVVPGVYWLARQFPPLAEHRWALLAACLAAINPYSVYYSRDLKMYGLMLTLFTWQVAWFWSYQANGRTRNYWAAIATFIVATLVHGTAWWLVIVHGVTVLVRRRGGLRLLGPTVLMWLLASVGPAFWYTYGTRFLTNFAADKDSVDLWWISRSYDLDAKLVAGTPAVFVTGLAIPQTPPGRALRHFFDLGRYFTASDATATAIDVALAFVAGLVAIGAVPWSRRFGRPTRTGLPTLTSTSARSSVVWLRVWATVPVALLAMMSLPQGRPFRFTRTT